MEKFEILNLEYRIKEQQEKLVEVDRLLSAKVISGGIHLSAMDSEGVSFTASFLVGLDCPVFMQALHDHRRIINECLQSNLNLLAKHT